MMQVLQSSWALLLGMGMMMLGNGLQGSLLGVRGGELGFSTFSMSIIMSAYFVGFLLASRVTPDLIRRVGHVRVFAALGSFVSAVLIMYPAFPNPIAWTIGRVLIGFCYCGVYVTAESWLNNSANNANRGQALSLYMIVQMVGIILAQVVLLMPDDTGFLLFVVPSVLVSIAFAPILLSVSPTPAFETTKRMTLTELFHASPLACVGMFLMGGVFAAQFSMAAVYGTVAGMTLQQISAFIAAFYVGALVCQYPLGWLSDRMDRRQLVTIVAGVAGVSALAATFVTSNFSLLLGLTFAVGGMTNPLYSLLIAYANDYLEHEQMAASSAGLLFINGLGAVIGPLVIGWAMQVAGANAYFALIAVLLIFVTLYGLYRMTQRPATSVKDSAAYPNVFPTATPVVVEVAQEFAIDTAIDEAEAEAEAEAQ